MKTLKHHNTKTHVSIHIYHALCGSRNSAVSKAPRLWAGRSGVRTSRGEMLFLCSETSKLVGYHISSWGKSGTAVTFTTHLHLMPRLRMTEAKRPFLLYAIMAWTGINFFWIYILHQLRIHIYIIVLKCMIYNIALHILGIPTVHL
jgi:hypothetical protein